MIHAVHCWGTVSQTMTVDALKTLQHTPKINNNSFSFYIIPRFQNHSKNMKPMERHIQLIISVPCVICLSLTSLVKSHEARTSLTCFSLVGVKIHLQPEYRDKQFTVTNLHTRIDSYL